MQAFKKTKKKKRKLLQVFKAQRPARMECRSRPSGPQPATDKKQNKRKENKRSKTHLHNQKKENKTIPQLVSPQFRSESSDVIG